MQMARNYVKTKTDFTVSADTVVRLNFIIYLVYRPAFQFILVHQS
jgi:hypothetical protein